MKRKKIEKNYFALYLILMLGRMFFSVPFANATAVRPHLQRTGVNMITNASLDGATFWSFFGDAAYDPTVSRDAGTGSLRFTTSYPETNFSYLMSGFIPVEPGTVYTFATYTTTDAWPSSFSMRYTMYDSAKNYIANGAEMMTAQSTGDEWQESVFFFNISNANTHYIRLSPYRASAPRNDGHIWIDNIYFGEGIGFEQPSTPKIPFEGSMTRVDELGNVELFKNGAWEPFFPICVYADNTVDWNVYSRQGFNCNMWAGDAWAVGKAKNAVSDFNPEGMYAGVAIAGYLDPSYGGYNNTTLFTQRLTDIKNANLMDHVLWYYWDNETNHSASDAWSNITNVIKALDIDANGKRLHPIYALQGNEGISRMYEKDKIIDIVGDYTGPNDGNGLIEMNNLEKQTDPVVVGQINLSGADPVPFRRRFYDIILSGGKAIGWYRDCTVGCDPGFIPFIQTGLYTELPKLRREIDAMMPIIREPEWTDWSFASSDATLRYGTREHDGEGYLIVLNTQDVPITTTLSTTDLPYVPTSVADYFTNSQVTTYANSQFTITLEANATAVYKLPRPEPSVFANDSLKIANKKVTFGQAKKINTKSKTISFNGANSLIANGSVQLYRGGTLVQTTSADATGVWSVKVKEKKDTTVTFYLRYLDSTGTELGTSAGYKIKIDSQKPKITNLPIFLTKSRGDKLWWEAKDNVKVTNYKISFLGKTKTTKSKAFTVPLDSPSGLHLLSLKAYDAMGNSTSRLVTVRVR